ncbi:MAG: RHS repeat-associated core domain-containing protein [Sediminibacterium sp.]|nr:RHS repeat-associated core domain-containing protein [Sediminibacterium sp.]
MLYGAGGERAGMLEAGSNTAYYELSDHLGNVRTVITAKAGTQGGVDIVEAGDYYPHGGILPGTRYVAGGSMYRYGYQGQERDAESGLTNFELRQYDPRLGRWNNPDPYGQHHSPYLAMSNNPVNSVDPDGGFDDWYDRNSGVDLNYLKDKPENTWSRAEQRMMQGMMGSTWNDVWKDHILTNAAMGGYRAKDGSVYTLENGKLNKTVYLDGVKCMECFERTTVVGEIQFFKDINKGLNYAWNKTMEDFENNNIGKDFSKDNIIRQEYGGFVFADGVLVIKSTSEDGSWNGLDQVDFTDKDDGFGNMKVIINKVYKPLLAVFHTHPWKPKKESPGFESFNTTDQNVYKNYNGIPGFIIGANNEFFIGGKAKSGGFIIGHSVTSSGYFLYNRDQILNRKFPIKEYLMSYKKFLAGN